MVARSRVLLSSIRSANFLRSSTHQSRGASRSRPCALCDAAVSDLRFSQSRALGRKVNDEFTVPLCRGHHREVHRYGDEAAWWNRANLDPLMNARVLWLATHPLPASSKLELGGVSLETSS